MYMFWHIFIFLLIYHEKCTSKSDSCNSETMKCDFSESTDSSHWIYSKHRFLLYDINPGEGFNLRRDVYMRVASLVKKLNMESSPPNWILVLPPWGPLYHWKSTDVGYQVQIKWSKFFDIQSLSNYVPVIELQDFLTDHGSVIDMVYYLQHYVEGWSDSSWEEKADLRECIETPPYDRTKDGNVLGWFWGFENIYAKDFQCLSIQGYSSTLKNFLLLSNSSVVMIDRAEVILHDSFGDSDYWKVRQSMVFSKQLIELGNTFRKNHLNSTIEDTNEHSVTRRSIGGPYVGVHLRRADFALSRSSEVPSIKHAAYQISAKMRELDLKLLFVATDSTESEFQELKTYIPEAKRFKPSKKIHQDILDGGVAIVDQWICANSRFFIGTYESTFSFRIQEEREILGFPVESTFNRLCGDNQTVCTQPTKWTIAWS